MIITRFRIFSFVEVYSRANFEEYTQLYGGIYSLGKCRIVVLVIVNNNEASTITTITAEATITATATAALTLS